jgi:hypothetical protein
LSEATFLDSSRLKNNEQIKNRGKTTVPSLNDFALAMSLLAIMMFSLSFPVCLQVREPFYRHKICHLFILFKKFPRRLSKLLCCPMCNSFQVTP